MSRLPLQRLHEVEVLTRHQIRPRARVGQLAAWEVQKAVKRGDLAAASTRKCADCGEPAEMYDHRDYAKPLEVEPVCRGCNGLRGPARAI